MLCVLRVAVFLGGFMIVLSSHLVEGAVIEVRITVEVNCSYSQHENSHDALEFIDICIIQKKQKMNGCETEKTKGEVIELTNDMCGLQSVSAERLWMVCNGFRPTTMDIQTYIPGIGIISREPINFCTNSFAGSLLPPLEKVGQ